MYVIRTILASSLVAAAETSCKKDQMMLQTNAARTDLTNLDGDRLHSSAFCCYAAKLSGVDFCGSCWPTAVASPGDWCASKSRCGQCGGTWCPVGNPSTPAPAPVTVSPSPVPTSAPSTVPSTPVPEPPTTQCSDDESDCQDTQCCNNPSMQCYEKDAYWASCKKSCTPGVQNSDPIQYRTPWTCKILGESSDPTPETPAPSSAPAPSMSPGEWDSRVMKMTHYWDCSGQGCDATVLQPWVVSKYVSPPGYGPQDPNDFGGAMYGEKMWLTGAASDVLADLIGNDDGCCGSDSSGSGGCGRCLLVQNPDSLHPDWTAVVMKKNRCPPWATGCGDAKPHFDIAAPGFDNLQWSLANICGAAGTGFDNQGQSEAVGSWWTQCGNTADCAHLCEKLPVRFVPGCKLFASWGWYRGDPEKVRFRPVVCPAEFTAHVGRQFGENGVTN